MKKKLSFACGLALLSGNMFAQTEIIFEQYGSLNPGNTQWYDNLESWEPGKIVDENFFVSRVRPKKRFVNSNSQVYPQLEATGKKVLWWMPISNGNWYLNMPSHTMRNDIFSLWSYLDIHGGWNQSMINNSGTFSDVCHKNGVRNTVVMFFDRVGGIIDHTKPNTNEPSKYFSILLKRDQNDKFVNVEKFVKMFRYYGIGGWSINPESSLTYATANVLQDFIAACHDEAERLGWGDQWNVCWYDAMNNNGGSYSWGLNALTADRINWFAYRKDQTKKVSDHFFLNYNHSAGAINKSIASAQEVGRSPYDVYVGQYIGGRGLGDNWKAILESKISIGTWGEHSQNNIFYNSTDKGSAPQTHSEVYTEKLEMFFCGGNRNPQNTPDYITSRGDLSFESLQKFNGLAKGVVAQSTLTELPFITYFSLGNGMCNYEKGEKISEFQWYNIGMQDHMPTWRWWIVDDANNVPASPIKCDLSYQEAYMGANSLKISGATTKSNIRLFKTEFAVKGSENLSLIYKTKNSTDAKMKLIYSLKGSESTFKSIEIPATSVANQWSTATWKLSDCAIKAGDKIACIGLSVENTDDNYETYIGGISLVDPAKKFNPAKPVLVETGYNVKMNKSAYNFELVKLIWNSKINEDIWTPVYNDDVDTWYFEIMVREDGGEPQMVNRTTSWATVSAIQVNATCRNFEVGVRAVAPDGVTRSEISWYNQQFSHEYEYKTGIVYDARKLIPEEEFTVSLEDPTIPTAHWTITDDAGATIYEADGTSVTTTCPKVGLYNLTVKFNNPTQENPTAVYEHTYDALIQVTPAETGRFPQANFEFNNDIDISDGEQQVTFRFNGIKGEGHASNAVDMRNGTHFFAADPNVLGRPNTITLAAWIKPTQAIGQVLSLRELSTNPSWGSTWIYIEENKANGNKREFCLMGRHRHEDFKDMYSGVEVKLGIWYHIAMTLDNDNQEVKLYVNGKRTNTQKVSFKSSYDLYALGTEGFQGSIDEVQFWNKALSDEEVKVAMYGYKPDNIPAQLRGYWAFEEKLSTNDKKFPNLGSAGSEYPSAIFKGTTMQDRDNVSPIMVPGSTWLTGTTPLTSTLTWEFDGAKDIDLTDPENPVVTYDKEGKYVAKLTVKNAYGSDVKTVLVNVQNATSVNTIKQTDIVVSPTDVDQYLKVQLAQKGNYLIQVYNSTGILQKNVNRSCCENEIVTIDMNVPSGIYFVKVISNDITVNLTKVIKK